MTDVRLTALNPVDSQVYPVACNTSGELIVEQVDPGPDLTVTGDLTVDGSTTLNGSTTLDDSVTFNSDISGQSATFAGDVQLAGGGSAGNTGISFKANGATVQTRTVSGNHVKTFINIPTSTSLMIGLGVADSNTATTTQLNTTLFNDGSAVFKGDITCSENTKGLILKSSNGTLYRLSVADDGTLSTSAA
jgi:hypothetical protein